MLVAPDWYPSTVEYRQISGGALSQTPDRIDAPGDDPATWTLASGTPVPPELLADLAFAWRAIRSIKSNAILLAHDRASVGVGMGQVNRVDAARLAVTGPESVPPGRSAASDAYFPFPDGLEVLIDAGVRAVVATGRIGTRPRSDRRRGGRRPPAVPHRHAPLLPLMPLMPLS